MTICNMSIEAGARAGMIAPDDVTFSYLEGRPAAPQDFEAAVERWRSLPTDAGATFDAEVTVDASALVPQVTWGTNPGQVVPVTGRVPDPAGLDAPADRESAERALAYMALEPGTAIEDIAGRPGVHRLVHELPHRGPARGGRNGARPAGRRDRGRDGRPGLSAGQGAGRAGGPARGLPCRRVRLARGRLLDVPRDEPGHPPARRALRVDVEPQLRGPPGPRAGARTSSAPRWPRRQRSPATSSTSATGTARRSRSDRHEQRSGSRLAAAGHRRGVRRGPPRADPADRRAGGARPAPDHPRRAPRDAFPRPRRRRRSVRGAGAGGASRARPACWSTSPSRWRLRRKQRLAAHAGRWEYVLADLSDPCWSRGASGGPVRRGRVGSLHPPPPRRAQARAVRAGARAARAGRHVPELGARGRRVASATACWRSG